MILGVGFFLIFVFLGVFVIDQEVNLVGGVGGVYFMWFGIWFEIVWCFFWVLCMIMSLMFYLFFGVVKVVGFINVKKWKDIGWQFELYIVLFFWFFVILVLFMLIVNGYKVFYDGDENNMRWIGIMNKVIIVLFVFVILNFIEKILI